MIEAAQDLGRRKCGRARLRRARSRAETFEPAAQLDDGREVLVIEQETHDRRRPPVRRRAQSRGTHRHTTADGVRCGATTGSGSIGNTCSAAQMQRRLTRDHHLHPGATFEHAGEQRRGAQHVFEVVEEQQHVLVTQSRRKRIGPLHPGPGGTSNMAATSLTTRPSVATPANGTVTTNRECWSRSCSTTSTAETVLPTPPRPVTVTSRMLRSLRNSTSAACSTARPRTSAPPY